MNKLPARKCAETRNDNVTAAWAARVNLFVFDQGREIRPPRDARRHIGPQVMRES
jgi:hypothetical protein